MGAAVLRESRRGDGSPGAEWAHTLPEPGTDDKGETTPHSTQRQELTLRTGELQH